MNDAVLVQHGVGHCAEMIRVAAPFHEKYCAFQRIDYRPDFAQRRRIGESLFMEKILLLLRTFADYPDGTRVAWLDADALIVDPKQDIRNALQDGYDLTLLRQPDGAFNSGVMVMRNNATVRRLFESVKTLGGYSYKDTHHDEGRINWLLDPHLQHAIPAQHRADGLKVHDLADEWNRWRINRESKRPTFIKAWHGENHMRTRNRMLEETRGLKVPEVTTGD